MITQNDVQRLFGRDVYETDGSKIGSTGQVYLDRRSGAPAWVSVKTGLFGTKESLVPLQQATLSEDRIVVPFDKAQIKNAPRVEPDDDLSPAEEDELYRYYGLGEEGNRGDQFAEDEDRFRAGRPGYDPDQPGFDPDQPRHDQRLRRFPQGRAETPPAGEARPGEWAGDPERR